MVLMRKASPEDWRTLRDIRLAALRDTPDAFTMTHDQEAAFTEADWLNRISGGGVNFLAYLPEVTASEPVGLVGGYWPTPGVAELVAMYVRPQARGRGVGEALVGAVLGWARAEQATAVHLWVNESNKHARLLYERCGFSPTGERQPLRSDQEIGLVRKL
jgi:GNAT superfamily N-acetyltransferase